MEEERKIEELQRLIDTHENIVFFGGAGVSTESGIPDFRSVDGLYHQKYDVPPETILSHSYFLRYPEKFYAFYRDKMLPVGAKPNAAHKKLAELEAAGKLKAVVSITIDDEFVVHDIKVIEGEKGMFIAMPSKKAMDGEYRDIAHPINSDMRNMLESKVLAAYDAIEDEPAPETAE